MQTIHFLGLIVPGSYKVSMEGLPASHYRSPAFGLEIDIHLTVKDSTVDVACTMDAFEMEQFGHVHKIAFDGARRQILRPLLLEYH